MKAVKDFVDMMKDLPDKWVFLKYLKNTREYEALKALSEKPVSKMEITDEMIKVASKKLHEQLERVIYHNAEALAENALEAVFGCQDSHMPPERPLKELIEPYSTLAAARRKKNKAFTGMMEQINKNPKKAVFVEPEEKEGEWIEHHDSKLPTWLSSIDIVQVKKINGEIDEDRASCFNWTGKNGNYVVAYRFISEPKESKKDQERQRICESIFGEEPKQQTLEEFCIRNTPYGNLDALTPSELTYLYSEYFSQNR